MANSFAAAAMDLRTPTPEEIDASVKNARVLRAQYIASLFSRPVAAEKDAPITGAATA